MRGPQGTPVGELRRVSINNIRVYNSNPKYGCIISGIPGHYIRDIDLNNIRIYYQGGGTAEQASKKVPEQEKNYPEPNMFGDMPSQGFFIRHAKNVKLSHIEIAAMAEDARPAFVLNDVSGADLFHVKTPANAPVLEMHECHDVNALWVRGLNDGAQR